MSQPHGDRNNYGPLLIVLFGEFAGGTFRVPDRSLDLAEVGTAEAIDGTCKHESEPFVGERYSIVAFLHNSTSQLEQSTLHYLYESLFILGGPPDGCLLSVPRRFVVEICCSQHSYLRRPSIAGGDVSLLRITQKDDFRDERTYQHVLHNLRKWGRLDIHPMYGGEPMAAHEYAQK